MKIALLGSAPSSAQLAPFRDAKFKDFAEGAAENQFPQIPHLDDHWEIWGCSPGAFGLAIRATAWFELHRYEPGQVWFSPQYCQWLRDFKGKVYTGAPVPELPNHVVYPLEAIEDEFHSFFLTSSVALMLALAIKTIEDLRATTANHDPKEDTIGLWGIDMAANEEYGYQRMGCQHFILEALRRGIGILVPPESDILRPMPVYGICEHDHSYIKATARMRELVARKAAHTAQVQANHDQEVMLGGAIDNMNYFIQTWLSPIPALPCGVVIRKPLPLPGTSTPSTATDL